MKALSFFPTANTVPDFIRNFQPDVYGTGGIVAGIDDLLSGRAAAASWVLTDSKSEITDKTRIVRVALGEDGYGRCFRYVSADLDPDSVGTHSVQIGGLKVSLDRAQISAILTGVIFEAAGRMGGTVHVFRVTPDAHPAVPSVV